MQSKDLDALEKSLVSGIRRVTDFGQSEIMIEWERWHKLPRRIQEKLEAYNMNPDAFAGRKLRFRVGNERVTELLEDMAALNA